jgi:hypothetical protein
VALTLQKGQSRDVNVILVIIRLEIIVLSGHLIAGGSPFAAAIGCAPPEPG